MFFFFKKNVYSGATAVEIVRKIKRDSPGYRRNGDDLRDFLVWSLERLSDRIPLRELLLTDHLDDETLALSYLCLLDEYELGELDTSPAQLSIARS